MFSFTSHFMLCAFLYQNLTATNDQTSINGLFEVLYPGSLSIVFLTNYWMIFCHWSLLHMSGKSWHAHFVGVFGHQLLLEPNIYCHAKLHYECSYHKYYLKGMAWFVNKGSNLQNFPHVDNLHFGIFHLQDSTTCNFCSLNETCLAGLPLIEHANPRHLCHLKSGMSTSLHFIPQYFLWTHVL